MTEPPVYVFDRSWPRNIRRLSGPTRTARNSRSPVFGACSASVSGISRLFLLRGALARAGATAIVTYIPFVGAASSW
jgi:hypothetical protein